MRIALYHCLPPGGALRAMSEIVRRSSAVHEYELFTVELGDDNPWVYAGAYQDAHGVEGCVRAVHRVPLPYRALRKLTPGGPSRHITIAARIVAAEKATADLINAGGFDLAFVHHSMYTSTPTLLPKLAIPSVYYCQEARRMSYEAAWRRRPRRSARQIGAEVFERALTRLDAGAMAGTHLVACNSYFSREAIYRAYAVDADVCYLGVNAEAFTAASAASRRKAVVAVGALSPMKGHELVIEGLGRLDAAQRPGLDVIYERYDPGYDDLLRALARVHGVELSLHRGIDDAGMVKLYQTARATVCAGRLEPFGLTTLESLSCGTPVVAIREGGYREVINDGSNGVLVDGDADSLAEGIARVLAGALPDDPEIIRASVVATWSWDRTVERLHMLFDRAVRHWRRT